MAVIVAKGVQLVERTNANVIQTTKGIDLLTDTTEYEVSDNNFGIGVAIVKHGYGGLKV